MDIETLSMFLDDKETYQKASKELFLRKLEDVFNMFKSYGDTELEPYAGTCGFSKCLNKGCNGYSFFGNVSNDYMSLIIEEKDGILTDIQNCLNIISENWSSSKQIDVIIYVEEQFNFVPSIEYLIFVQNCETALYDLKAQFNNKLTRENCFYWLSKNEQLRLTTSTCNYYGGMIKKFHDTFDEIKYITSFTLEEKNASIALSSYNSIKINDENQLMAWIVEMQEFGQELELFHYNNNFADTEKIKDGFLPLKNNDEVSLLVSEYKNIGQFLSVFSRVYCNYKV